MQFQKYNKKLFSEILKRILALAPNECKAASGAFKPESEHKAYVE